MIIAALIGVLSALIGGSASGSSLTAVAPAELRARISARVDAPERKKLALAVIDQMEKARTAQVAKVTASVKVAAPLLSKQDTGEAELKGVMSNLLADDAEADTAILRLRGDLHAQLTGEEWEDIFR